MRRRRSLSAATSGIIERLESRRLLSAITWTGSDDGKSWNDPGNWSGDAVPTGTDDVTIPAGATPQLGTGTFAVQSLTLQGNAQVDLQSATLFIDYGALPDPVSTIYSYLASGYNGGAWNGTGIISSTTAAENVGQGNIVYDVGYADGADGVVSGLSSGQIEIMPTLAGDCSLTGGVTASDVSQVSGNLGDFTGENWDEGDFTYNGEVDWADYQCVTENYGDTLSSVPIPGTPTVTLSLSASNGYWAAYAQTNSAGNNDGLYSVALDVVGGGGLSVLNATTKIDFSLTGIYRIYSIGASGVGILAAAYQSESGYPTGVGLTGPVEVANGTYTGSGSITLQPDLSRGLGFQTYSPGGTASLLQVNGTHYSATFDTASPITVNVAPMVVIPTTWTGGGNDNNWSDPSNWSGDAVPAADSAVTIPAGSLVQLGTGTFTVASLTLQGNASLDLQSATLFINYDSLPDPISTIYSYLTNGAGNGWAPGGALPAIVSSTVASMNLSPSFAYDVGYADGADGISNVSAAQIEIMPTLGGDAKLNGNVVFGDFNIFATYFGKAASWDEGNFTYTPDGAFGDYQLLEGNIATTPGTLAPTVTLTISASNGQWTAYAQTDSGSDNIGLASAAFDVVGSGGLSVTSSQVDLPVNETTGAGFEDFVSNGVNGIGMTAIQEFTNATAEQGVGKGAPVEIATGTYSGDGALTVQPDYQIGQGFQTLNIVSGGAWEAAGVDSNISFDKVISGSTAVPAVWTGADGNDNWTDPANWSGDAVPTASSDVIIPTGSLVVLGTGSFVVQSLTLQGNANLDLQQATLFLDYALGPDPITTIVSYLTNGYGNEWSPDTSNAAIVCSTVAELNASQVHEAYDVGYIDGSDGRGTHVPPGYIQISPTIAGDARLTGTDDFGGFQLLALNFDKTGTSWDQGNFTYGKSVNFGDFQLVAQNFDDTIGQTLPIPPQSPATIGGDDTLASSSPLPAPVAIPDADGTLLLDEGPTGDIVS
ncbi:MAG TPA: hypothetical protein VL992_07335 [Tepidisphaeraceae bacterium]|nr:hypothetical protein [Tepidisphaeraceae bacterium]